MTFTLAGSLVYDSQVLLVAKGEYVDGSLSVQLCTEEGEPYATLSVRMPGPPPPEGVFFLKQWSENIDIADAFLEAGLCTPAIDVPHRTNAFVMAWPYRLSR